jgi:hypothetical protein
MQSTMANPYSSSSAAPKHLTVFLFVMMAVFSKSGMWD